MKLYCILLTGCNVPIDFGAASGAVSTFHERLNKGDYASVYNDSDKRFRDAVKQEEWSALGATIRNKLGTVSDATREDFHVNCSFGGSTASTVYSTKFTLGKAPENFLFAEDSDGLRLLHYHISSDALVAK